MSSREELEAILSEVERYADQLETLTDYAEQAAIAGEQEIAADPVLSEAQDIFSEVASGAADSKEDAEMYTSIAENVRNALRRRIYTSISRGGEAREAIERDMNREWFIQTVSKTIIDIIKGRGIPAIQRILGARQQRIRSMRGLPEYQRNQLARDALERYTRLRRYGRAGLLIYNIAEAASQALLLPIWRNRRMLGAAAAAGYAINKLIKKKPVELLEEALWTEEEAHTPPTMNYNGPGTHFEDRIEMPKQKAKGSGSYFYPANLHDAIAFEHDILYASPNLKINQLADVRYIKYVLDDMKGYVDRLNSKGHKVDLQTWKDSRMLLSGAAIASQALARALGYKEMTAKNLFDFGTRVYRLGLLGAVQPAQIRTGMDILALLFSKKKAKDISRLIMGENSKTDPVMLESLLSLDEKPLLDAIQKENPKYIDIINRGADVSNHMYTMMARYGEFDDKGAYIPAKSVDEVAFGKDVRLLHKKFNDMNDIQEEVDGDRGFRKVSTTPEKITEFVERLPAIKYEPVKPSTSVYPSLPSASVSRPSVPSPSVFPSMSASVYPSVSKSAIKLPEKIKPIDIDKPEMSKREDKPTVSMIAPPVQEIPGEQREVQIPVSPEIIPHILSGRDDWRGSAQHVLDYYKGKPDYKDAKGKSRPAGHSEIEALKKRIKRKYPEMNFATMQGTGAFEIRRDPSDVYYRVLEFAYQNTPKTQSDNDKFMDIVKSHSGAVRAGITKAIKASFVEQAEPPAEPPAEAQDDGGGERLLSEKEKQALLEEEAAADVKSEAQQMAREAVERAAAAAVEQSESNLPVSGSKAFTEETVTIPPQQKEPAPKDEQPKQATDGAPPDNLVDGLGLRATEDSVKRLFEKSRAYDRIQQLFLREFNTPSDQTGVGTMRENPLVRANYIQQQRGLRGADLFTNAYSNHLFSTISNNNMARIYDPQMRLSDAYGIKHQPRYDTLPPASMFPQRQSNEEKSSFIPSINPSSAVFGSAYSFQQQEDTNPFAMDPRQFYSNPNIAVAPAFYQNP